MWQITLNGCFILRFFFRTNHIQTENSKKKSLSLCIENAHKVLIKENKFVEIPFIKQTNKQTKSSKAYVRMYSNYIIINLFKYSCGVGKKYFAMEN